MTGGNGPRLPGWVTAQVFTVGSGGSGVSGVPQTSAQIFTASSPSGSNVSSQSATMQALHAQMTLPRAARFDPKQPDTLGWRAWYFRHPDDVEMTPFMRRLISPVQKTVWETAELRVEEWNDSASLRGVAGIHARLMPYDWRSAGWPDLAPGEGPADNAFVVTGVVERFGRYVLGTTGWRAEWVIIRALMARSTEVGLELEKLYPDVPVYYRKEESDGYWRNR